MNLGLTLRSVMNEVRGYWQGPYTLSNPNVPLSASLFGTGYRNTSGVTVSEDVALTYSAVWSAVSLISSQVASLPLMFYKRLPDGSKQRFDAHPLYWLLHDEPNDEQDSVVFRETLTQHLLLWGNAYAEIVRNSGGVVEALYPITPNRVQPFRAERRGANGAVGYGPLQYRVDGQTVVNKRDILHLRGLGFDGTIGYSVIRYMSQNLGLALATEQFGASFFGNGATFGGILTHPSALNKDVKQGIRESIEAAHQGPDKAHKFIILGGDMKYTNVGIPPNEAQFLDTRKLAVEDIARWFMLAPYKLRRTEGTASYASIEQQGIEHVTDCLLKWLVRWERALGTQLVADSEKGIQFFEHKVDGLLRGDIQSRYNALGIARDKGIINADEWREIENMNPQPNGQGKLYLVQSAQIPVDQIAAYTEAQIEKLKQKPTPPQAPNDPNSGRMLEVLESLRGILTEKVERIETERDLLRERAEHHESNWKQAVAAKEAKDAELEQARQEHADVIAQKDAATEQERTDAAKKLADAEADAKEARDACSVADEARRQADADVAAKDALLLKTRSEYDATIAERDKALEAERARVADETAKREAAEAARVKAEKDATDKGSELVAMRDSHASTITEKDAELDASLKREQEIALLRTAAEQRAAEAEAARVKAAEAVKELDEALSKAISERDDVARERDSVRSTAEERAAALAAESAARAAEKAATKERLMRVMGAHREQIVADMGRMVRRETEKARRNQGTPAKLRAWAEGFYLLHEDTCVEALRTVVRTHLAWIGSDADAETFTRDLVRPQLKQAEQQLRAIADGDPEDYAVALEKLLTRWEQDRPVALADRVLQQEIRHVSTL